MIIDLLSRLLDQNGSVHFGYQLLTSRANHNGSALREHHSVPKHVILYLNSSNRHFPVAHGPCVLRATEEALRFRSFLA